MTVAACQCVKGTALGTAGHSSRLLLFCRGLFWLLVRLLGYSVLTSGVLACFLNLGGLEIVMVLTAITLVVAVIKHPQATCGFEKHTPYPPRSLPTYTPYSFKDPSFLK